jgi:hypothetical protein
VIRQVATYDETGKRETAFAFTPRGLAALMVVLTLAISLSVLGTVALFEGKAGTNHTRSVQKAGEPTGVCLREAMRFGLPILNKGAAELEKAEAQAPPPEKSVIALFVKLAHETEAPLAEYVLLQEARYLGVECPDKPKPHGGKR